MNGPLTELPADLPSPQDGGEAAHLEGMALPKIGLVSSSGREVDLSALSGLCVVFAYPMTGEPGRSLPSDWLSIPGAPGCTLETCGFRDHYGDLVELGAAVFGLSTQSPSIQKEAKERLQLPFELLSDEELRLTKHLDFPTMSPDRTTMIKRLTLICEGGMISHVFYPVFPPDRHAEEVVNWIRTRESKPSETE